MFTTRVELHDANYSDYEKLHGSMEGKGFTRTVRGDNGILYKLPTAEYNYTGYQSLQQVFDLAKAAAIYTGKRHWILVSETNARRWELDAV